MLYPLMSCAEEGTSPLRYSSLQNLSIQSNHEKTLDKSKLMNILQNTWLTAKPKAMQNFSYFLSFIAFYMWVYNSFWVNFLLRGKVCVRVIFLSFCIWTFNYSSIIFWNDLSFLHWTASCYTEKKSIDHIHMNLFLESLFYSFNLYVYSFTNNMLLWLL